MITRKAALVAAGVGVALAGGMVWSAGAQGPPKSDPSYWETKKAEQAAAEAAREKPESVLARFIAEELPNPCDGSPGWYVYLDWLDQNYGGMRQEYSSAYHDLSAILAAECAVQSEPEPVEPLGYTIDDPQSYADELYLDMGYTIYRGETGNVVIPFTQIGTITGIANWESPGDEGIDGYNSRCSCLTVTAVAADGTEYAVDVFGYDGNAGVGLEDYSETIQWKELRVSATRDWQLSIAPEGLLADIYD